MQNNKSSLIFGGAFVLIVLLLASIYFFSNSTAHKQASSFDPSTLPGMQLGSPPWHAEISQLKERLQAIGLPALSAEGNALHTHQHLDIFLHGQQLAVPAGIGINEPAGFIAPIHTHDTTGVIHVESPTQGPFTLGQFFDIWGVPLTAQCIGNNCVGGQDTLEVYENGKLYEGDPRNLPLTAHEEIAILFGKQVERPSDIPSSYTFPAGD